MTHEEHHSRAMLMGCEYDWTDGTYINFSNCSEDINTVERPWYVDCLTLEMVDVQECARRSGIRSTQDARRQDPPTLPPWDGER